jgi:hypothetical protein
MEETKGKRWLAIYGAMLSAQVQQWTHEGNGGVSAAKLKHFMEEAAAVADLEAEERVKSFNEGEPLP